MYPVDEQIANLGLQSNYWRINYAEPQRNQSPLRCLDVSSDLIAVGSTLSSGNVQIFRVDAEQSLLGHLATFNATNIRTLKWLNNVIEDSDDISLILTGDSSGLVNLNLIPNLRNPNFESVQIIKQFNHEKHCSQSFAREGPFQIDVTPKLWKSCPTNSMVSTYKETVFLWDTSRSSSPVFTKQVKGISAIDVNKNEDGIVALAGSFGVSLLDMRLSAKSGLSSSSFLSHKHIPTKNVKWCSDDSKYLCAAGKNNELQLWDVRSQKPLSIMKGHSAGISSIEWTSSTDIFSGSDDGTLIHWNLKDINTKNKPFICSADRNDFESHQCGTPIEASNTGIVSLKSTNRKLISMDANYVGLHHTSPRKTSRQFSDSDATLVEVPDDSSIDKLLEQLRLYTTDGTDIYL
ncbi:hypothetical protein OGAPHI_004321 [Ogataea philodendri]|uniref:Uncharacterized protein n=1 Tax=Ogataea philodendri TaxID=1378263 RepID=A0A9P8P7B1_9ASCO|nr:uncharacterized protein OGAPHI_004321 [Ogataea philodendri]KAH3666132.1 hypothetical protein OGAPHI_004321 [Ogataea philodendri]